LVAHLSGGQGVASSNLAGPTITLRSMPEREAFSLAARVRSFEHAFRGVRRLLATQHNAWIHAAATAAVLGLGILLGLGRSEWVALLVAVAMVWVAESFNTAIEHLCDRVSPEFDPLVGHAKDVAAGGVLIAAGGAALIGLLVLGPPLLAWLR
jgi:diacylglycerol kinase (ATP)